MPNAFALGRSQKAATVCATTGIMELLSPAELEGVMAHELTHIANRDVAIMTLASFFASLASMIVQFGFFFGGGDDDDDGPGIFAIILVSLAVYVISFFLMQALSRYREFAADRGAAVITGRPSALSSALMKISGTMQRIPQTDLRAHAEMNAFYIFPAGAKKSVFNLFSTHPPMEKRIEALSRLEAQLQGARVSCGAWGSSTRCWASARSRGRRPTGSSRSRRPTSGSTRSRGSRRAASPASSSSRWRRATSARSSTTCRRSCPGRAPRWARRWRPRTTSSATAG